MTSGVADIYCLLIYDLRQTACGPLVVVAGARSFAEGSSGVAFLVLVLTSYGDQRARPVIGKTEQR